MSDPEKSGETTPYKEGDVYKRLGVMDKAGRMTGTRGQRTQELAEMQLAAVDKINAALDKADKEKWLDALYTNNGVVRKSDADTPDTASKIPPLTEEEMARIQRGATRAMLLERGDHRHATPTTLGEPSVCLGTAKPASAVPAAVRDGTAPEKSAQER